jgi:DNA-binding GntR family transcriptional regulator
MMGRPLRAMDEHRKLIELIAKGDSKSAEQLMEYHILSALEDIVRYGTASAGQDTRDAVSIEE